MRKVYFILFGLVLVVLIVLVDWREKFSKLTQSKPAQALGHLWSEQPNSDAPPPAAHDLNPELEPETAALDKLDPFAPELGESLDDLAPIPTGQAKTTEAAQPDPPAASQSGRALPEPRLPPPQSFQDLAEQPYLNESRQLLQQTLRNYERISPPARNSNRQPQP